MLANRPRPTGTKWDAAIAAVMEHTAEVHGYEPPSWVNDGKGRLKEHPHRDLIV